MFVNRRRRDLRPAIYETCKTRRKEKKHNCWGFGHYYRACPVRLGPEAAAQAGTYDAIALAKGDKGKGKGKKGKGKFGKGKGKGVYGVEGEWDADAE